MGWLEDFEAFWALYPRKIGKGAARQSWGRINPGGEFVTKIMASLKDQCENLDQWRKSDGQYVPHPATWLNQERWEDEVKIRFPEKDKQKAVDQKEQSRALFERLAKIEEDRLSKLRQERLKVI